MPNFVHLHNHSEFSLLDGLAKIPDLVQKTLDLNMDSLALTDHGTMYGIHYFYVECIKKKVKPIIGCETYVANRTRFDKDPDKDKTRYHLVLLAKNNKGYKNLMHLITLANLEGFYYKPRVDWEILEKYHEGIIATSACPQGEISRAILDNDFNKAEKITNKLLNIFKDDFYLEIQRHENVSDFDNANKGIIKLSQKFGIPIIATNDVHYVEKDDAQAQDALLAIGTKKLVSEKDRITMLDSPTYYLKSPQEMETLFSDISEVCQNTVDLAKKVNIKIELGGRILPKFEVPEKMSENKYLRKHVHELAQKRFPDRYQKEMKERLDYELGVIINKGYASYFLIYEDFTKWSKDHGIRIGPGRGSAAGSLVSFVLNITTIDPLFHDLPFERFLNPARPTPPDIDMDFADDRRDETIDYVRKKYGEDKVAQIITFGRMEARAAIRDIGRVLGFPYSDPDRIAKLIPFGYSIQQTLNEISEFKQEYESPTFRKLIDLAKRVEGNVRHASIHAAALVVAPKPFYNYCPLQFDPKNNKIVTQYDMHGIDCNVDDNAIGLLKMDFLGLRNLSILQRAIDIVKKHKGEIVDIDNLKLNDKKVFDLISKGKTIGVFQMESAGMRRVAKNLKPNKFSDIAALVALYRPGPMDLIDDFIAGKENPDSVSYPHEDLKPVLEETYGIAVYQEQCLQIANIMAGYSLGEADILRRAIGKKIKSVMAKEKEKFTEGALKKGYTQKIIDTVWGYIEKFAGYGFNKAHSVSYGMIAYQTAWMKVHYPVEFMTALLSRESQNKDKITIIVEGCNQMGIEILPPDINKSEKDFAIEKSPVSLDKQAIRFGFSGIKNVGDAAIEAILSVRKNAKFKSLSDFFERVDNQKANKRVIESLIQVGAFDKFGKRTSLLAGYEKIRAKAVATAARKASGQTSFFDTIEEKKADEKDELPEAENINEKEVLNWEKKLLGFYLTNNPVTKQMNLIKDVVTYRMNELDKEIHVGKNVILGGSISSFRKVFTKKNNAEMAFITLDDQTGSVDTVIFPKIFSQCKDILAQDKVVVIKGKLDVREGELSFLADNISEVNEKDFSFIKKSQKISIEIPRGTPKDILVKFNNLLKQNKGDTQVILHIPNGGDIPKKITLPFKINYTDKLQKQIDKILH